MRCTALAQELKKNNQVLFLVNKVSKKFYDFFNEQKIKTKKIGKENIIEFLKKNYLNKKIFPVMIFDDYKVNLFLLRRLKKLRIPTIYFSDIKKKKIISDIIIDQNLGSIKKNYKIKKRKNLLIGKKFSLIRNEIKKINMNKKRQKILITLGGGNNLKNFKFILNLLKKVDSNLKNKINLVFTINKKEVNYFNRIKKKFVNIKFELLVNSLKIWKYFPKVNFSINGGGITSLELAYLGIPQLVIVTSNNQRNNALAIDKLGLGFFIGEISRISTRDFKNYFFKFLTDNNLKKKIYNNRSKHLDGLGASRIVKKIENRFFNK